MNPVYSLLSHSVEAWVRQEKENSQSLVNGLLKHIEARGKLRPPQKEAVQTYLWIKFEGGNRKLSQMIKDGLLYDEQTARTYQNYRNFGESYVGHFLNQFFQDNGLSNLHRRLVNDPWGDETDWGNFLDELLHDFDYANYLFSLPMGAGKTFLMACFIYLDLHFSLLLQKRDERFAHNFVIFAPHAAKTAILPSLRTIRDFDPEWALPKADADRLRRVVSIEVLDSLGSKRRDKLHGNNPNLEKVNRLRQTRDFGMVFITNAEKVVLEKYDDRGQAHADSLRKRSQADGSYTPLKVSGIRERLTKELIDFYLEEIYKLDDAISQANAIVIIYAHKAPKIDQKYLNRLLHEISKTELKVKLAALDDLLAERKDAFFTPDGADIRVRKQKNQCKVEIKKYYSPYLKNKIDEYNARKTQSGTIEQDLSKRVEISKEGLELIEAVQFDTTLKKVWKSNPALEGKAGAKEKIKGAYLLDADKFKLKIRNIAGDEIILASDDL